MTGIRSPKSKHRFFVPEVVQTSAMDCGPATLKCLLEGFGIPVSYGRLREACQTDVDGTSIDTMEEVALQLGLDAEQIMVPAEHVLMREAGVLPAIVVVRLPGGVTHFVVAWRRHGAFVQLMDPATGRRWLPCAQFLDEVFIHDTPVPAVAWIEWARSDEFLRALHRRFAILRLSGLLKKRLVDDALSLSGWQPIAALDASARMVESIAASGGIRRGRQAAAMLDRLVARVRDEKSPKHKIVPDCYWSVRPAAPAPDGTEQLRLRGAVLVHIRGRLATTHEIPASGVADGTAGPTRLSPELAAALEEPPSRPGRELLRLLRKDGFLAPAALSTALALAAGGVVLEALVFRSFFDIGRDLRLTGQRLGAFGALLLFVVALLILEMPLAACVLRLGRKLETRLRLAFLEKIPRLGDRYFHSRLNSDMAERSHSIHRIRLLPDLGGQFLRSVFQLALTTLGIAWLDPPSAPLAILTSLGVVGLPLCVQPLLLERDLRVRSHNGALSRFYLDALIGLVAVRAHGAERSVRGEHRGLLAEWTRATLHLQRTVVTVEGMESLAGFGLVVWLLFHHLAGGGADGRVLLLVYWALNLPLLGQEIALITRQYPADRSATLRLLEPLGAREEGHVRVKTGAEEAAARGLAEDPVSGVSVALKDISIRAAGHEILRDINLSIEAGSHVAIVGPSGAGKSSLVGILLGWHRPAGGRVLVNGQPLDGGLLERLRSQTAWVDPAVQLWNRSLLENLHYGTSPGSSLPIAQAINAAELRDVLARLPDGLQTTLGEAGGLVSGGEGQRVRLGRALLRPGVRLVILDEPFRGLDRERRTELLARARNLWKDATLLCITHDIGETRAFERVLVIEEGHIVEDGRPDDLCAQPESRYRAMLEAEEAVRTGLWSDASWRRLWLQHGMISESQGESRT